MIDHERRKQTRVASLPAAALLLCVFAIEAPEAAAQLALPSDTAVAGNTWQRQQPTRDRTQELLRQNDGQASPADRREELRTLNQIHRELMPPGVTVPAPGVIPQTGGDAHRGSAKYN